MTNSNSVPSPIKRELKINFTEISTEVAFLHPLTVASLSLVLPLKTNPPITLPSEKTTSYPKHPFYPVRWIEEDPFGPSLYPDTAPQAPMTAGPSLIIASPSLIAHRHQFGQMLVLFEQIHF